MPAKVGGSGRFDSDAFADVGQGAGEAGEVELLGLVLGQDQESCLQVSDPPGEGGWVQAVAVGDQLGLLGG